MKVIVFGATGKTGRHVLRHAIEGGHEVTAFARSPHKIDAGADGLRVVQGDVMDADSVSDAVAGHDAAVVVIGSSGLRDRSTLTEGTRRVVAGMTRHGVRRLVALSAAGLGESWSQIPWSSRLAFRTFLRNIYADHGSQEALVRDSDLDWTIVRAAVLSDKEPTGRFTPGNDTRTGKITRGDLAAFLVQQLDDRTYLKKEISVTG